MDALWGFLILYFAVSVLMFCTLGLGMYRVYVVSRNDRKWIRACALLGFALGAALWPLVIILAFVAMLADSMEGGSPC